MKRLLAPELERAIRLRIQAEIGRESLWKQFKRWRGRRSRGAQQVTVWFHHLFPAAIAGFIASERGVLTAAGLLALWWFGEILVGAGGLRNALFGDRRETLAEENLPLTDDEVFELQVEGRRHTRGHLFGASLAGIALVGVIAEVWVALPVFVLLHWLLYTSLAPLLALRIGTVGLSLTGTLLMLGAAGLALWGKGVEVASVLVVLPTGWLLQVLLWIVDPGGAGILALVPILLLAAGRQTWLRQLRARYQYREAESNPEWNPVEDWEFEDATERPAQLIEGLLEPTRLEKEFGWIERKIFAWLTPRERLLLEAFGMFPLGFTRAWKTSWLFVFAYIVLVVGISRVDSASGLMGIIGLFFLLCWTLSPQRMFYRVFQPIDVTRGGECYLGGFPVGMMELLRMGWKGCLLRTATCLPQLLVLGLFVALVRKGMFGRPADSLAGGVTWSWELVARGGELTGEFTVMALFAYPFLFAANCVSNSHTNRDAAAVLTDFLAVCFFLIGICAAGAWVLFESSAISTVLGLAAFALVMWMGFIYCRRVYHDGGVDMVREGIPNQE